MDTFARRGLRAAPVRTVVAAVVTLAAVPLVAAAAAAQGTIPVDSLPSETPARFTQPDSTWDFTRRDVMIPMRDGVKLHTVILVPKGAAHAPILLTRTPYDAGSQASYAYTSQMGPRLNGYDNALDVILRGGYIRVIQDIRGKYGSEGDYVMNRPMRGPLNPTDVDESTDTWDTIDWLVKHVPESNGKVGILGISYDGYLSLTPLVNPHPALKVAVPMNPMVDGWMGDDWFHHGAFRAQNMPYILEQEASRTNEHHWWTNAWDDYDLYMDAVSAGRLGRIHGLQQVGFWRKIVQHPDYDRWWQLQAMDSILAREPLRVPVMLVHSLWDQEDIYGAPAVYRALEPKDTANDMVYLVMGPWHHGQEIEDGRTLGALRFDSNTSLWFQRHVLEPFLAHYLKDGSPPDSVAPVTAYLTGADRWERLQAWPSGCSAGCDVDRTPLYLEAGMKVGFRKPAAGDSAFDAYVSDPARPVPFRLRPIQPVGYSGRLTWPQWLVDDQREASGRTDVLAYESDPLTDSVQISGRPLVHLVASTTGTDADWVVKLIDVYPPQVAEHPEMGGYQLAVSMDIFRGR
ncbi:MAG TPA: CocE/NonD family hydrolase, partial [Gemmatimonadota bacterium]|nr:CocE/NonD family hydrolase [Gemmatimonadota bacterium]